MPPAAAISSSMSRRSENEKPTGDWNTLVESISKKLYTLDEEMIVYPGHGEPTTIGFEKRANPFV